MTGLRSMICALNSLKDVDIAFFIICAAIIAVIVGVYFLIPVLNKKFYQEQRENLYKREKAFHTNLQNYAGKSVQEGEEGQAQDADGAKQPAEPEKEESGE